MAWRPRQPRRHHRHHHRRAALLAHHHQAQSPLGLRPAGNPDSPGGRSDTPGQPRQQRDIRPRHDPAVGIHVRALARMARALLWTGMSSDTDIRGAVLFRPVRGADVDVLEEERRGAPRPHLRSLLHRHLPAPLPHRVHQEPSGRVRADHDAQHGPVAQYSVHPHRSRSGVVCHDPSEAASHFP